jgi:hypothetical protein
LHQRHASALKRSLRSRDRSDPAERPLLNKTFEKAATLLNFEISFEFSPPFIAHAISSLFSGDLSAIHKANVFLMAWNASRSPEGAALDLIANSQNNQIQCFCALILLNRVKKRWMTSSPSFRNSLRSFLIDSTSAPSTNPDLARHFAQIIVAIALYEVPGTWHGFSPDHNGRSPSSRNLPMGSKIVLHSRRNAAISCTP